MIAGYDMDRVIWLGRSTGTALGDLAGIVSDDPAAAPALDAAGRLRAVLVARLAPSIAALRTSDPLGDGASAAYRDWLRSTISTPYRDRSDDELFRELDRLELELPYDDDGHPDPADPFWNDFEVLAIELAVRAELDDDFAAELAARSADAVLIPIAVRFARFAPELVASMLFNVARSPSAVDDLRSRYQAFGADGLAAFLSDAPIVALDLFATAGSDLLKELMEWPFIDPGAVSELLDAAMAVPFAAPSHLGDAFVVLQHLVTLSNRRRYETGFPAAFSPTFAQIVVQYLPFFVTSLDGHSDVHLKNFEFRDAGIPLGRYEEVLDLIGSLLRDAPSRDIVLGAVPAIALIGAGDNGPLGITPDDVANLVETINRAALNEQIEEQLKAARNERNSELAIDVVFGALELVTQVTGPVKVGGVEVPLGLLKRGTLAMVEWAITATDLELDDVANVTFLLVVFGLTIGLLRSRDRADDDADERRDATEIVREIEERTADGATMAELEGLVNDLARVSRTFDEEGVLDIIDDPRVRPPDVDVRDVADPGG